jgi:hypothetical protein
VIGQRRSPDPTVRISSEPHADAMIATMAGTGIALKATDVMEHRRPGLAIVGCMLPAGIATVQATRTPVG